MRIASFLPSATEILFAIGAGDDVCAVTFECDYPPEARTRPQVVFTHLPHGLTPSEIDAIVSAEGAAGRSLYFVDLERMEALAPTLVVLQDLCHVCAIDSPTLAREMAHLGSAPEIISLGAHTLHGILAEIEMLGRATGRERQASAVTAALRMRLERIRSATEARESSAGGVSRRPRVLCLEWLDPPFQGGHWIPEMVSLAGGEPVLATAGEKSVRLTWDQVAQADPEIIVLMPCGYDLAQTIAQYNDLRRAPAWFPGWQCLSAVRSGKVYAVNGTAYFSRPGPRLVDGAEILQAIIGDASLDSLPKHSVMLLAWPAGHKDVPAGV